MTINKLLRVMMSRRESAMRHKRAQAATATAMVINKLDIGSSIAQRSELEAFQRRADGYQVEGTSRLAPKHYLSGLDGALGASDEKLSKMIALITLSSGSDVMLSSIILKTRLLLIS
jgi:hypothetical protein